MVKASLWPYCLELCLVQLVVWLLYFKLNLDRQACQAQISQMMLERTKIIRCKTVRTDDTQQEWKAKSAESIIQLASPRGPASLKRKRQHE